MNKEEIADKLYEINRMLSIQGFIKNESLSVEQVRQLNKQLGNIIKELRKE